MGKRPKDTGATEPAELTAGRIDPEDPPPIGSVFLFDVEKGQMHPYTQVPATKRDRFELILKEIGETSGKPMDVRFKSAGPHRVFPKKGFTISLEHYNEIYAPAVSDIRFPLDKPLKDSSLSNYPAARASLGAARGGREQALPAGKHDGNANHLSSTVHTKENNVAQRAKAAGPTERTKDTSAAGRLKDIGRHRQRVVRLRSELRSAKERVKEINAELKQAIEGLLTEAEQPSLPLDMSGK